MPASDAGAPGAAESASAAWVAAPVTPAGPAGSDVTAASPTVTTRAATSTPSAPRNGLRLFTGRFCQTRCLGPPSVRFVSCDVTTPGDRVRETRNAPSGRADGA